MSSELQELEEFNQQVSKTDTTQATRTPQPSEVAYDSSEGSMTTPGGELKMWAVHGGRNYIPCEQAVKTLPPGQYRIERSSNLGIYWSKIDVNLDELIKLPDSVSDEVIQHIEDFWSKEKLFRKFGSLWKRGVLLWGPQGSGKTSTVQFISKHIIDLGGISVYVDHPQLAAAGLKLMRQVEPKRPIVIMMEDIDAIIQNYGESDLLAILDGELQIDNVCSVATTNYPERLDKRFVNRPSRFDIVRKIGMPNAEARSLFLKHKNPRLSKNKEDLQKWVLETKGFSIAHLKELITSVEIFGNSFEETISRLKVMATLPNSSSGSGAGFINTGDSDS